MSTRVLDVGLELPIPDGFTVVGFRLTEGASEVTHARVEIATADELDLERALTQRAVLTLSLDGIEVRRWTLVVGGGTFLGIEQGALRYEVDLYAPLWLLGLGTTTRKFRDLSARGVVDAVLAEARVERTWRLVREPRERSYCAQYRETNLAFVSRLLEHEGIFHTTDAEGASVFADRSSAAPAIEHRGPFELIEAGGALDRDALGIHALTRISRVTSGCATVNDHDWKQPALPLRSSCAAGRDAELEVYDYPSGFRDPAEGELLARMRVEALRVPSATVEGRGNVVAFAPAHVFPFGASAGDVFAGSWFLTHVEHVASLGRDGKPGTYENRFRAMPREAAFRPALGTPRPRIGGTHTALVRGPAGSEIHTDRHGRFKAQFHWDRDATGTDVDSRWVRMLQETATSMTLARVGWELNIGYIDGDPDRPIGLSRHINGAMPPAYGQPQNKNMMAIRTPSSPASGGYSELKMDDSGGSMRMDLRAEKDFVGLTKNDKTERIGNDETHTVGANLVHAVAHDQGVTIGASSTVACGADYDLAVSNDRKKTVGADESIDVGSNGSVTVNGNDTEKVGSVRLTLDGSVGAPSLGALAGAAAGSAKGAAKGAGVAGAKALLGGGGGAGAAAAAGGSLKSMVPKPSLSMVADMLCHGSITRQAKKNMSRRVGGAFVSVAVDAISTQVGMVYAETIGGAKITLAKGSISQTVGGPMATTVGGAIIRLATGDISFSAKNVRVNVGGVASYTAALRLTIEGAKVKVSAAASLKLEVGGMSITLAPGGMSMAGAPLKLDAADKIVVTGGPISLTRG